MTLQERRSWIFLVVSVVAYAAYAWVILTGTEGGSLVDSSYQRPLLIAVGASIVACIVAEVLLAIVRPIDTRLDVRDKEIRSIGDFTGSAFVVIGGVLGLVMAMAEWDYFWIANVIYLGFVVSAIIGSLTKIGLYHQGLPS